VIVIRGRDASSRGVAGDRRPRGEAAAGAEVGEPGGWVSEQVPDDDQDGAGDGDLGLGLAAAAGDPGQQFIGRAPTPD